MRKNSKKELLFCGNSCFCSLFALKLYRTYKGGIRLTTQQIRFFLEAAECLNFTEAAKRLFVAQSTLSKQIALLEDELGLKLFYRSNRTVGLTRRAACSGERWKRWSTA